MTSANWKIGDVIEGRWELHRAMQGGMGIVYVVYDRKWQEVFAAKTFQDQVFARNLTTKGSFEKEAAAWIGLDLHPNIAEARFLQVINGKPFLFLEFVSGGDLGNWIGTPRLTEDLSQVLRLSIHLCDGMRHINYKGIKAHRDIKPQNCLITEDGVLKLTDFGLAKVLDEIPGLDTGVFTPDVVNTNMTRTGTAAGTCTHMAPEQFLDSKRVDVRADIYSFGVMLFQMLTGELPFFGRDFREFALLHMKGTVPLGQIQNPHIRTVIERCLRKNPEQRYKDFDELRRDLSAIYKTETGQAPADPVKGNALTAHHLVNKGKSLGDLGRLEDSITCFDKAIELAPSLAEAWLNKGASLTEIGRDAEALVCIDRCLTLNADLAVAWANKGQVLIGLERFAEALNVLRKAAELNPRDPAAWYRMGCAMAKLGKHAGAVEAYRNVVSLDAKRMEAWFNMGHSLGLLGQHNEAIKCCDRALAIDPRFSQLWILKGLGFCSIERYQEALGCFQQAEKLGDASAAGHVANCRKLQIPNADAYFRRGSQLQQAGSNDEAVQCYEAGLAVEPNNALIWNNLGAALLALKRIDGAIKSFQRALSLNPRDASAWNNKGLAHLSAGQHTEALRCIQEAKRLRE